MNIFIVGLGLMGGSFAKAIKAKTAHIVSGLDKSEKVLADAKNSGAIDYIASENFLNADIILIALYPKDTVNLIERYADIFPDNAVIIDLCGVKRYVCQRANEALKGRNITYIGSHPMAGREFSGFASSTESLFENASMILTPSENTPKSKLKLAEDLFLSLGFREITYSTPERHDEIIALTSQLAHIVSSAYVQDPAATAHMGFSAGSFHDMTRVAKLNESMWTELFLLNSDFLSEQISGLIKRLEIFREYITENKEEELYNLLKNGREIKENLKNL